MASDERPTLWAETDHGTREVELTPRARAFVGAVSVPRELTEPIDTGVPAVRGPEPSSEMSVWTSQEIVERMHHGHRSSIPRAIDDLRKSFHTAGLDLDSHLNADKRLGRYGLKAAHVDVVEILRARSSPEQLGRLVARLGTDPATARLAPATHGLFDSRISRELSDALADVSVTSEYADEAPVTPASVSASTLHLVQEKADEASPKTRRVRVVVVTVEILSLIAMLAVVAFSALPRHDRGSGGGRFSSEQPGYYEVAGGSARTWSDPEVAGGRHGKSLQTGERVLITCKVRGFRVPDGNIWWYRIASAPWSGKYYATADAFYNNGKTSGPLKGTAFVDPRVPTCR